LNYKTKKKAGVHMDNNQGMKQLPDVFKELQQSRFEQEINEKLHVKKTSKRKKKKQEEISRKMEYEYVNKGSNEAKQDNIMVNVKRASIATLCVCALVLTVISRNYIFATDEKQEEVIETATIKFEPNKNAVNLTQIVSQNTSMLEAKDYVVEERAIEFETVYIEDTSLQKDEKIVSQEGTNGKEEVKVVKTYQNGEFIGENVIDRKIIEEPVKSVVHIGTSEFLSTYQVHLGDVMYVTDNTILRKSANASSEELAQIDKYMDVKLLELEKDWCKINYDSKTGYVKASSLTSESFSPTIVELSRMQKALGKVSENMKVNESSGLSLEDFKKALSGNTSDKNKIFENNAQAFYNADKNYNINGIFLAGIAINESAWGTSTIASTKKNLFGYGAYDSSPLESSYTFEDYKDGIDMVAKVLAKYYVNAPGTKIYDGEIASGKYFHGSTVKDVNIRYATDTEWHKKVYSYMEYLYNKLK